MKKFIALLAVGAGAMVLALGPTQAGPETFHDGPLFGGVGRIATVDEAPVLAKGTVFKVVFDVADDAKPGKLNRGIESAARFINMNVEAGVPKANIKVAIVIHGSGSLDVLDRKAYRELSGVNSRNAGLLSALLEEGVEVILCGQSAAYHDVKFDNVVPGVKMELSAMNAHALLQQKGYTLNPF